MADFQIGGVAYQSRLLDGGTQTAVLKRMLPVFAALMGCREDLLPPEPGESLPDDLLERLMPVARELASLADADVEFIIAAALDVTSRQAAGGGIGWAKVRQNGLVQDQNDAKFITRLTIAWHVLSENFAEMLSSFGLDAEAISKAAPKVGLAR